MEKIYFVLHCIEPISVRNLKIIFFMQTKYYLFIICAVGLSHCASKQNKLEQTNVNFDGKRVKDISVPEGYLHQKNADSSFALYLQKLSLKADKTVYLFNGSKKQNQTAQYAVLDISVGNKDLQQCADAVMRLRAEYFFKYKKYESIVFYDNENTKYAFAAPFTRDNFDKYLQRVFGMCGSKSLEDQLKPKANLTAMQIGDVWIKGGFPGHAVVVIDMATNEAGEKLFMLAQSYMPAQSIHILKNPNNENLSPWYKISEIETILETPEYTFTKDQLRSW